MKTVAVEQPFRGPVHPKKFALWLGLASIVMMFAGLTSAYIVRKAAGDWVLYRLPDIFAISTVVIVLSSVCLQWAYSSIKKEKATLYKGLLVVSWCLGFLFLMMQYSGWKSLTDIGIRLTGNPSGSFLYVISGLHALHLVGGLIILLIFIISAFKTKDAIDKLLDSVKKYRFLKLQLLLVYWHFIGALWIYLYLFFWYNSM